MHLVTMIVDNFKSYRGRVEFGDLDRNTNVINSAYVGKTNLFDAFLFVLGTVRNVDSLDDLIYKKGSYCATKAVVTLVFDNRDASSSPPGFEQCERLTVTRALEMGGRSKYQINGRNTQLQRVANLFHSVQLDVNNLNNVNYPHCLITHGRMAKTLSMLLHGKPREVLGMIEDAAGTRMLKKKRQHCIKTLEKKDVRLQRIASNVATAAEPSAPKAAAAADDDPLVEAVQRSTSEPLPVAAGEWHGEVTRDNEARIMTAHELQGAPTDGKAQIEDDKATIEATLLAQLTQPNEAMREAISKVSAAFAEIFSTLMPGARLQLKPVEDGLAIHDHSSKELVALAFVLALERLNPAPLYLLDEVDVVMRWSDTQNFYKMIEHHFKGSQFVIISRKEGRLTMVDGANAVFRTRHDRHGGTVVQRIWAPKSRRAAYARLGWDVLSPYRHQNLYRDMYRSVGFF